MATTYTITVQSTAGGNKYFVNGVQQDSLTLQAGETYIFDQSDASNAGHPLALSATSNGTHGGGSEYTYNVTKTGTEGTDRLLYFSPDNDTTTSLYYYCEVHSGMGGSISVSAQTQIDPQVNFFKSTLSGTYADDATSFTIATGDGALLPDPSTDGEYNLTVFRGLQVNQNTNFEIVRVLSKSGDVLTVNRGIEGTTALTVDSEVHSILMSATKKVFNDIDTQIDNLEVYDQTLNTTSDVAFNSVDVDSKFILPIKSTLPSVGTLGEVFYFSPKETVVFFDGSAFKQIDASYLVGLGVATAQVTANGITLAVDNDFIGAQATAFANDATTVFLSSASRSLGFATATAQVNESTLSLVGVDFQFLIIAGGGGGGSSASTGDSGGGAGAGGYLSSVSGETSGGNSTVLSSYFATPGNYTVTVGAGGTGAGGGGSTGNTNGSNSSIFTYTADGGGKSSVATVSVPSDGGSGGGGSGRYDPGRGQGSATVGQGFDGRSGRKTGTGYYGGGGGGAGSLPQTGTSYLAVVNRRGGQGIFSSITGTSVQRGGGGSGGQNQRNNQQTCSGGQGGGGGSLWAGYNYGQNGSAYTGGGGGGAGFNYSTNNGGNGGSGTVILLYPSSKSISLSNGATARNGVNVNRGDGFSYTEIITSGTVTVS